MKTALICALLALVPLSSLRMVCVTGHADATRPTIDAEERAAADAQAECDRICRHKPEAAREKPATPAITCLLVADPTCELLASSAAAILPRPSTSFVRTAVLESFHGLPLPGYAPPAIRLQSPPPKA
jgi:hypothetical protein